MEEESLMNIKDISETEIKDAVAYQKYLTEGHSHTSGTVVSSDIGIILQNNLIATLSTRIIIVQPLL